MSMEFSYALAQDAGYLPDDTFSYLYPFGVIRTNNSALVGDKTQHPLGFTQQELIDAAFQAKTYRSVFPAHGGYGAQDVSVLRSFMVIQHGGTTSYLLDTESFDFYPPNLFEGNASQLATYLNNELPNLRQLQNTRSLWHGVAWRSASEELALKCFVKDLYAHRTPCYLVDGLYYPRITFEGIRIGSPTVRTSSYEYAHPIAGGSLSVFGKNLQLYAQVSGFSLPTGMSYSIGTRFNQDGM